MGTSQISGSKPAPSTLHDLSQCSVHLATADKAEQIVQMFESALGNKGIKAPGHDPYPDPDLFSYDGVLRTINSSERRLVIAEVSGVVAGGMIIDQLSPFHCEFNCMAVRQDYRGRHIGTAIVKAAKEIVEDSLFTVNTTELVTHSLASQAAHFRHGYNRIFGFGYCHYPNVFFANHPESVLWVSRLQGKLAQMTELLRRKLGSGLNNDDTLSDKIRNDSAQAKKLRDDEMSLLVQLLQERTVYVPEKYSLLAKRLLNQHGDILDYKIETSVSNLPNESPSTSAIVIEPKDGYGHAYLIFPSDFKFDRQAVDQAIQSVRALGKRFILARIDANNESAISTVDYLSTRGFVFHSLLPVYALSKSADQAEFRDVISMQWVDPKIVQQNPLPGETDSVIKLYGYPENLSAPIISLLQAELPKQKSY